jgi:hypothetical protein
MPLLYKPDWQETKDRMRSWWAHDYFGRCAIAVTAPKADPPAGGPPHLPASIEERWFGHDYLRAVNDYHMGRTYFGGEAIPIWHAGYPGWGSIPCFLGCRVELDWETGWVDPILGDGDLTDHDFAACGSPRKGTGGARRTPCWRLAWRQPEARAS